MPENFVDYHRALRRLAEGEENDGDVLQEFRKLSGLKGCLVSDDTVVVGGLSESGEDEEDELREKIKRKAVYVKVQKDFLSKAKILKKKILGESRLVRNAVRNAVKKHNKDQGKKVDKFYSEAEKLDDKYDPDDEFNVESTVDALSDIFGGEIGLACDIYLELLD